LSFGKLPRLPCSESEEAGEGKQQHKTGGGIDTGSQWQSNGGTHNEEGEKAR
jgi:hypothetical protein